MLAKLFSRTTYPHKRVVASQGGMLTVCWTDAAEQAFTHRTRPLIVEMQLYFSCNIKKLVYFHDSFDEADLVVVDDRLRVCFRPIKAKVCDPVEFARSYPEDYRFDTPAARKMGSRQLKLDYSKGQWVGSFMLMP